MLHALKIRLLTKQLHGLLTCNRHHLSSVFQCRNKICKQLKFTCQWFPHMKPCTPVVLNPERGSQTSQSVLWNPLWDRPSDLLRGFWFSVKVSSISTHQKIYQNAVKRVCQLPYNTPNFAYNSVFNFMFTETINCNTPAVVTETEWNTQAEPSLSKGKARSRVKHSLKSSSPTVARCGICQNFLKKEYPLVFWSLSTFKTNQQEGRSKSWNREHPKL